MNFLDAIATGLAAKNNISGIKQAVTGAKKKKEDGLLANTQSREQAAALSALAGGGVSDGDEDDSKPMGNISTATGEPEGDLYRITSGEEEMPEITYEDLVGDQAAAGMAARMGGGVPDEPSSRPMGNSSPEIGKGPMSEDRILPVEGDIDLPMDDDLTTANQRTGAGNPLIDPTVGARPAGIPEETLAALFKKTHGGSFDSKSKTDRDKMRAIEDMIQEDKSLLGLSPSKFALKVYARK